MVKIAKRSLSRLIDRTGLRSRLERTRAKRAVQAGQTAGLAHRWWYYTVELDDGVRGDGQFPDDMALLPRVLMRDVDLHRAECLDMGSMEGLIPVLMKKAGAARVLATDFEDHCAAKMAATQAVHGVDFDFQTVGLMYDLHRKVAGGFDLVNCSGLLYHVWSLIDVLAGVRPLVKRGGLLMVSTNITTSPAMDMRFNSAGHLQAEENTFWYPSARLLDYTLRYLKLRPVSARYQPHEGLDRERWLPADVETGIVGILCRAVDTADDDEWMARSAADSWEYKGRTDWARAESQPRSTIKLTIPEPDRFDVHEFVTSGERLPAHAPLEDSTTLLRHHAR